MKKFVIISCLLIFIFQLSQIIYFQRSLFAAKYDTEYWRDRYEHSQYEMPLSKRTIGDDGVHAYAGYKLIQGVSPFSINVDKPPAGKYLLGLSILFFQNPLYIVLFLGICTLIVFYFIAKHFFNNGITALFATIFLFLDPLFFSQFWVTGLDLMQLFFLSVNILLLINIKRLHRWNIFIVLGSGLSLGFFAEIKPPIVFPVIFILETVYFFYKGFKKEYLFFILGLLLGILIPYLRFIYLGNGITDILRVHKFMASIYLQSQLTVHTGAIWITLLAGKFPNIVTGSLMKVSEWWLLWPMVTFFGVTMIIFSFFQKKIQTLNRGLGVFTLVTLIIFTVIPSYPRYLVIVLPFLYLFGINFIQFFFNKNRLILYLVVLIYGIINSFFFIFPKPEGALNGFYYNLSRLYFHDIFEENIVNNTLGLTREQFRHIANKALEDAKIKEIEVEEIDKNIPIFTSNGNVRIRLTYKTQELGSFNEEKIVKVVKRNEIWKIEWDWNIIFDKFLPDYQIETIKFLGTRGKIIDPKGETIAEDIQGYLISVNPEEIDLRRENDMLSLIGKLGHQHPSNIQNAYLENALPRTDIPLVSTTFNMERNLEEKLNSFPGLTLTPYQTRIYRDGQEALSIINTFYKECCTRIYSSYNYHGIKGIEKEYDNVLWGYSGGKIIMKDNKRDIIKIVFEKDKKDGRNVFLQ